MRRVPLAPSLGVALALAAAMLVGSNPSVSGQDSGNSVARLFVGNYELVSYETFGPNGEVSLRPIIGRIMYDSAGNMAAQLMPRERPQAPEGASPEERWALNRGYTSYFGKYEVQAKTGQVIHKVIGSVRQSWVGRDLVRHFEFSDGLLKLSLKRDARVVGTLTWRRLD